MHLDHLSNTAIVWLVIGFCGQFIFASRFLLQWLVSERKGESVIPIQFWYLSMIGSWILLLYSIYRRDPVYIAAQIFGTIIYGRNLYLIYRKRSRQLQLEPDSTTQPQNSPRIAEN